MATEAEPSGSAPPQEPAPVRRWQAELAAAIHPHPGVLGALAPQASPEADTHRTAYLTVFSAAGLRKHTAAFGRAAGHLEMITGWAKGEERHRRSPNDGDVRRRMENAARKSDGSWRRPPQRTKLACVRDEHGRVPPLPPQHVLDNAAIPTALVQHLLEQPRGEQSTLYALSLVSKSFRAEVRSQLLGRTHRVQHEHGPLKAWMEHLADLDALGTIERALVVPEQRTFMVYTKQLRDATTKASDSYWRVVRALAYLVGLQPAQLYAQFLTTSYLAGDFEAAAQQTVYVRARRETNQPMSSRPPPAPHMSLPWQQRMRYLSAVENVPDAVQQSRESAGESMLQTIVQSAESGAPVNEAFIAGLNGPYGLPVTPPYVVDFEAASREVLREPQWWARRLFTMAKLSSLCHGTDELCGGRGVHKMAISKYTERLDLPQLEDIGRLHEGVTNFPASRSIPQSLALSAFAIPQLNDGYDRLYRQSEGEKMDRLGLTTSLCDLTRHATIHIKHRGTAAANHLPYNPNDGDADVIESRLRTVKYQRCPFFIVNGAPILSDPATLMAMSAAVGSFADVRTMECAVHALGHGDAACVNRTEVSTIGADRIGPFDVEGALAQAASEFRRALGGRVARREARESRTDLARLIDDVEGLAPKDLETALVSAVELIPEQMASADERQRRDCGEIRSKEVFAGNLSARAWLHAAQHDRAMNMVHGARFADRVGLGPLPFMAPSTMRRLSDRAMLLVPHPSLPHVQSFAEAIGATPAEVRAARLDVTANFETAKAMQTAVAQVRRDRWMQDADRAVRDEIRDFGFEDLCAALPTLRGAFDKSIEGYEAASFGDDVFGGLINTKLANWARNEYASHLLARSASQRATGGAAGCSAADIRRGANEQKKLEVRQGKAALTTGRPLVERVLAHHLHVCAVPSIDMLLQRACIAVTTLAQVEHEATGGHTSSGHAYCWLTRLHRGEYRLCYDAALAAMAPEERRKLLCRLTSSSSSPGFSDVGEAIEGCGWRRRLDARNPLVISGGEHDATVGAWPQISEGEAANPQQAAGTRVEVPYLVAAGRIFDALDEGGDEGYAFAWRRQWRLRILLLPCSAADADGNAAGLVDTLQSIEEADRYLRDRERPSGARGGQRSIEQIKARGAVKRLTTMPCRWTWVLSATDHRSQWSDAANCVSGVCVERTRQSWTFLYEEMRAQARKHNVNLGGIPAAPGASSLAWSATRNRYPTNPLERVPSRETAGIACVLHAAMQLARVPQLRALAFHAIGIDPFAVAAQLRARDGDPTAAGALVRRVTGVPPEAPTAAAAGDDDDDDHDDDDNDHDDDHDVDEAMLFGDGDSDADDDDDDDDDDGAAPPAPPPPPLRSEAGPSGHSSIEKLQAVLSAAASPQASSSSSPPSFSGPRRIKRRRTAVGNRLRHVAIGMYGTTLSHEQVVENDITDSE